MATLTTALVSPITTEKTVGMENGKYVFAIHPDANKTIVKKAVEEFYGVKVNSVNIAKNAGKTKTAGRGRTVQKRSQVKKAIVTLADGATLDFNAFK